MLAVPLLTPRLSSHWLSLVTDVDTATARNLIDSMSNEVVVTTTRSTQVVPAEPMGYDDAVRAALRAARAGHERTARRSVTTQDDGDHRTVTGRRARLGRARGRAWSGRC